MQQFSGSFTITKKDNLRYNFFLMRKKLVATSILVFVIIFAMIGLVKYAQGVGLTAAILNGALMAVVGVLILVGINIAAAVWRINGYYKQKKLTDFSVTFTADKAGIHSVSERGDSDLPWNRIVEVRETRHAFYIFITDSHANVMPKEQFANASDAEVFRALLEKNVAKTRLKLKRA
ncbi:MAG: YcxB family protein [Eubacteriales bacterium]